MALHKINFMPFKSIKLTSDISFSFIFLTKLDLDIRNQHCLLSSHLFYFILFILFQGQLNELPAHLLGMSAASSDYLHVWLEVSICSARD
jgi:hypothetical protein